MVDGKRGDGTLHATGDSSTPHHTLSCLYSVSVLGGLPILRGHPSVKAIIIKAHHAFDAISILITCHRVFGSNHSLNGYAGGVEAKVVLPKIVKEKLKTDLW